MKQTKEYKVYRMFDDGSYNIGNRYMLMNDVLVDIKYRNITNIPLSDKELQELKKQLEKAVVENITVLMEDK